MENIADAITAFNRSLFAGRFPHAVLLEGGTTSSRKETAAAFISAWLCASTPEAENQFPCAVCAHCSKALRWIHPDVTLLSSVEGKQIPVDSVRELLAQSIIRPGEASRRVFVIEDAHKLNAQGQNALLKCIEEPPPSVCFLLMCPSRKELLSTIISRVTSYALPGDSESLSQEAANSAEKIASALAENDEWAVLAATAAFDKAKPLLQESLCALKEILRGGLLLSAGMETPNDSLSRRLSLLGSLRLAELIESVQSIERDLERNANLSLLRARISAIMFS